MLHILHNPNDNLRFELGAAAATRQSHRLSFLIQYLCVCNCAQLFSLQILYTCIGICMHLTIILSSQMLRTNNFSTCRCSLLCVCVWLLFCINYALKNINLKLVAFSCQQQLICCFFICLVHARGCLACLVGVASAAFSCLKSSMEDVSSVSQLK